MSQIIVEQQSHYTAKMTSNKHFLKVIHGNRDAKLEKFFTCGGRQSSLHSQNVRAGEILINSAPEMIHLVH